MDFVRILDRTRTTFGPRQVAIDKDVLLDALAALERGPDLPASAARDEILPGLRPLHVARRGRHARHFIMYRAVAGQVTRSCGFGTTRWIYRSMCRLSRLIRG